MNKKTRKVFIAILIAVFVIIETAAMIIFLGKCGAIVLF